MTNHLAVPTLYARYGVRYRQPLAGHTLLSKRFFETLDPSSLPVGYGVDFFITRSAIDAHLQIAECPIETFAHGGGMKTFARMFCDVAVEALGCLHLPGPVARVGGTKASVWWKTMTAPSPVNFDERALWRIAQECLDSRRLAELRAMAAGSQDELQRVWVDALSDAARRVGLGLAPDLAAMDLLPTFIAHAVGFGRRHRDEGEQSGYCYRTGQMLCRNLS